MKLILPPLLYLQIGDYSDYKLLKASGGGGWGVVSSICLWFLSQLVPRTTPKQFPNRLDKGGGVKLE